MADSKNVDQGGGCSGCGGGCGGRRSEDAGGKDAGFGGETAPQAWGSGIAHVAVSRMAVNVNVDKRDEDGLASCEITDEDIDGFIEECDRNGKNPLDVVKFVADENGIDLIGDDIGYSGNKAKVRNLLVGVLKRIILGFVSYVSDKYGLGIIQAAVNALSKQSAKTVVRDPGFKIVRVLPVGFGYGFTW